MRLNFYIGTISAKLEKNPIFGGYSLTCRISIWGKTYYRIREKVRKIKRVRRKKNDAA